MDFRVDFAFFSVSLGETIAYDIRNTDLRKKESRTTKIKATVFEREKNRLTTETRYVVNGWSETRVARANLRGSSIKGTMIEQDTSLKRGWVVWFPPVW